MIIFPFVKKSFGFTFLYYLRILAKIQFFKINFLRKVLGQESIVVVGITGSAGKTSAMLATVAALKDHFRVKYSEKANSESGIPLNILDLRMGNYSVFNWVKVAILSPLMVLINWKSYDVYVVEMGVDEPKPPKNMGYLLKIIKPKIGLFTGVTSVHSMQFEVLFPDIKNTKKRLSAVINAIADEKMKMITSLTKDGIAVLNLDDLLVLERASLTKAKVLGVGKSKESEIRIINYDISLRGTRITYEIQGKEYQLFLGKVILPEVYANTFGLAIGAAISQGVSPRKAIDGIKEYFVSPPGRSSLIEGIKNSLIIDSSYNSSPAAAITMIKLLNKLGKKAKRRRVAVLGDMRELGKQAGLEHRKLAQLAAKNADEIILVGKEMKKHFLPRAVKQGFDKNNIHYFKTAWQAADFLKDNIKNKDLVLVKGSQNTIFLEIVTKALMKDRKRADKLLCRRGDFWEKRRQALLD